MLLSPFLHACWPKRLQEAKNYVTTTNDGQIQLSSLEGHACVTLAAHRQTLTTSFLLRLAHAPRDGSAESGKERSDPDTKADGEGEGEDKGKGYGYVWTSMEHSMTSVPHIWRHSADLLLQVASGEKENIGTWDGGPVAY